MQFREYAPPGDINLQTRLEALDRERWLSFSTLGIPLAATPQGICGPVWCLPILELSATLMSGISGSGLVRVVLATPPDEREDLVLRACMSLEVGGRESLRQVIKEALPRSMPPCDGSLEIAYDLALASDTGDSRYLLGRRGR